MHLAKQSLRSFKASSWHLILNLPGKLSHTLSTAKKIALQDAIHFTCFAPLAPHLKNPLTLSIQQQAPFTTPTRTTVVAPRIEMMQTEGLFSLFIASLQAGS